MLNKHRGEFYLVIGAIFFSMNGVVVTLVLDHMTTFRLAQVRALGTFFLLFLITFIQDRNSLKAERREIPTLLFYGVFGYAMVQLGYFIGISRGVPLSLVLIIEFTAPIWIVLWIKFVRKSVVAKDMWVAIALSLLGLILVAKVWQGFSFDLIGSFGALGAALALAVYFLMSQSQGTKRSAQAMVVWGMGVAGLFWSLVLPIWNFPTAIFTTEINLQGRFSGYSAPGWLLIAYVIVFGTLVPYLFVVGGIRRLSASTSSVIGMLEPVLAGAFAWIWLSQSWTAIQLFGGLIVLIGIYIADRAKTNAK
ncbi:EamA-like transporter family protein [Candidatus Planktophila lacus]|jgi:drug/metabolite transporter (DMT)-like permease|uniref:DMT family transporter n=1 Tax=Candidatus Planktophila lacus TaxID=1884913 RepID=UPI000BAC7DC4|nr:DMT family transporter [Candidatus Planktophila lacus]ASY25695.1 EamA-like transporter family protein [Candidatus Planktophila lacus]ASY29659.1 EamA-like transporter family protein [Candidatus Planktophila lacus]